MIILIVVGYVLLCLMALLLLLLLLVIFVPFKYHSEGMYLDGQGSVVAMIWWLFGAVGIRYHMDNSFKHKFEIRLFWIIPLRIKTSSKKEEKKSEDKKEKSDKKKKKSKNRLRLESIKVITKSAKRIIRSFMPKRFRLNAVIGFDDAYHTGIMCVFIPVLEILNASDNSSIDIIPIFGEEKYEGSYEIEGKVVVLIVLIEVVKVFMSGAFKKRKR